MIQTDDPLPTQGISFVTTLVTKYRTVIVGASTIVIVSCFLFVAPLRALSESEYTAGEGRDSVAVTQDLCTLETRAHAPSLVSALCGAQGHSVQTAVVQQRLATYLDGYPMQHMADVLAQQDPVVAAYLIAIAKQESNWGKRVPVLNGKNCYNYWGFRAKRARMGTGGHTCFDSRRDAVETVARRVHELVYEYKRTTPRQMLVWKCGRSCATHDPAGVERWVRVIAQYYTSAHTLITRAIHETPTPSRTPLAMAQ